MRDLGAAIVVAAALLVAGCPKQPEAVTTDSVAADPYPPLLCPELSEKKGLPPPGGFKVWCAALLPSGQWVQEGGMITWWESGEKKTEGSYQADKKEGTWRAWYETGELQSEEQFSEGKQNGLSVEYHPNGNKKAEGDKVDGHEEGAWLYWHDNGNKFKEGLWKDGQPEGVWIEYHPDGTAARERTYKFGRLLTHREL